MRVLVFPDPDNGPSAFVQRRLDSAIARRSIVKLGFPPRGVVLWDRRVLGTPVPEAAVDIDGDPRSAEHNVGPGSQLYERGNVHSEAEAAGPQEATKSQFGRRIPPGDLGHARTDTGISRAGTPGCCTLSIICAGHHGDILGWSFRQIIYPDGDNRCVDRHVA
jgi:hypothetical protein